MAAPKKKTRTRRKEKKNVVHGVAHIKATFNNTIISISDPAGNVLSWASAGNVGFKGSRKSTPYAAQMAAEACSRRAQEHGVRRVDVFVKGPGSGRETAIRSLQASGLEVIAIKDVTPVPHNRCRPRTRLQTLSAREDEAVPQGNALRKPQVPDRERQATPRRARARQGTGERVPAPAA